MRDSPGRVEKPPRFTLKRKKVFAGQGYKECSMKYFHDFEFEENGITIEPISLGVVRENSKEFYAVNTNYDLFRATPWLRENVLPSLYSFQASCNGFVFQLPKELIEPQLLNWMSKDNSKVELIGYYSAYDHVCLSQLFGPMIGLPEGIPKWTRDIKQIMSDLKLDKSQVPISNKLEHNSLFDAR
ncbi:MAG: 3'-5' exoribonuclease [Richelia sp. SM1_7_0]|nr:3'-5' exoribonuclease [Richelia sp. SM1_7_0]